MTLQQLQAFLSVVQHGSFRRAARELGVSQAGLTAALQALEADLGATLLLRTTQGARPTPEGERLLPRATLITSEAQRARDDLRQAFGEPAGTLSVGLGPTPTAVLLPLVAPDFHAAFPQVRLDIASGFHAQLLPQLECGRIDLMVTALPDEGAGPGVTVRTLFRSRLMVAARAGHPAAAATGMRELRDCEWVLLGAGGHPGGSVLRVFRDLHLPPPRVAATCESFTQLAALIAATDWLALVPSLLVEQGLLGMRVETIAVRETLAGTDNGVVHRAGVPLTAAAAAFAAMCESAARVVLKMPGLLRRPEKVR